MEKNERLASLDVLRGIDLFFLVGLEGVMHAMSTAIDTESFHDFMWNFSHVEWDMTGYVVELETLPKETDYLFVECKRLKEEYALPTAFKAFRKWIQ